mgnify:CR=1 FL=1
MCNRKTNIIGLAGQSCAGKNVVADFLEEKGFYVIDADVVAHAVLEDEQDAVIQRFLPAAEKNGVCLRLQNGTLDRKALGTLLFSDPLLLAEHEAFILPKIEDRIRSIMQAAAAAQAARPIVLNAPTLHKTNLIAECSFIFYITAPFFLRLIRGKKRDGLSFYRLVARFLRQKDFFTQYLGQNADIVSVKNAHSVQSLRKKIERILRKKGF